MTTSSNRKSKFYLFIIVASAFLVGWMFNSYVKPTIIKAGCGQIAYKSSALYSKEGSQIDPAYSYDNLNARCLQDIEYDQQKN
jgi:hypothetical protein